MKWLKVSTLVPLIIALLIGGASAFAGVPTITSGLSGYLTLTGGTMTGGLTGTTFTGSGAFTSTVATGNNGFVCSVNGCRVDMGDGSLDYMYGDGTAIGFANYIGVTGAVYISGASRVIATGTTSPVHLLAAGSATTLVSFENSGGASAASVTSAGTFSSAAASGANGFACATNGCRLDLGTGDNDYLISNGTDVQVPNGNFTASGQITASSGVVTPYLLAPAATQLDIRSKVADGATAIGTKWSQTTTLSTAGARIVVFYSDDRTTEQLSIYNDGSLKNGVATASLATCNAGNAGRWVFDTTKARLTYCTGSRWSVTSSESVEGYAPAFGADIGADQTLQNHLAANPGNLDTNSLRFTPTIVGVGAGSMVMSLKADSTELCQLVVSCTAAVGTTVSATCPDDGGTVAVVAGNAVKIDWDDASSCNPTPAGNFSATWR